MSSVERLKFHQLREFSSRCTPSEKCAGITGERNTTAVCLGPSNLALAKGHREFQIIYILRKIKLVHSMKNTRGSGIGHIGKQRKMFLRR